MKIYHFSDSHGRFAHLEKFVEENGLPDVFVMTGDFFPNSYAVFFDGAIGEETFQEAWFLSHVKELKDILGGKPMVYVYGNHDFYRPTEHDYTSHGIEAYHVNCHARWLFGFTWAGFPHITEIGGFWKDEASDEQLEQLVDAMCRSRNKPDIVLTHSPPFGILDLCKNGDYAGIKSLTDAIATGKINPKVHFFGHIHECGGRQEEIEGTLFVNSATTIQRIYIDKNESEKSDEE